MSDDENKPNVKLTGRPKYSPPNVELIRAEAEILPAPDRKMPVDTRVTRRTTVSVANSADNEKVVEEYLQKHGLMMVKEMLGLALSPDVKHNIKLSALQYLIDRTYGKATQRSESHEVIENVTSLHLQALKATVKPKTE
ncbi:hypothetical protein FF100_22160 [Methylobacterium terricola]|uniref:Uncharacterized protein n=1 Tax=Methylobacterium terricola TaxID=2583531 RepID=A0A5C4LGB0_9HYPH|nr:hypothetical protein [Methylobacterium terricola]TNC10858.1 hypothetical protein FF100_22160 [Methylobacterium terricola]